MSSIVAHWYSLAVGPSCAAEDKLVMAAMPQVPYSIRRSLHQVKHTHIYRKLSRRSIAAHMYRGTSNRWWYGTGSLRVYPNASNIDFAVSTVNLRPFPHNGTSSSGRHHLQMQTTASERFPLAWSSMTTRLATYCTVLYCTVCAEDGNSETIANVSQRGVPYLSTRAHLLHTPRFHRSALHVT